MEVRVTYRPPYDWAAMLGHLRARAIEGVERVEAHAYERNVRGGTVRVEHEARANALVVTTNLRAARARADVMTRVRHLFGVDADTKVIGAHLGRDPLLAPMVRARPGLRVPGAFDAFELAMRAVLGQQITVVAAKLLGARLVELCAPAGSRGRRVFPVAAEVAAADLTTLGMPGSRKATLHVVARAAVAQPDVFDSAERVRALRGVGDWTAQYIALRAGRDPDAFPSTDVALLRAAGLDPRALLLRAERWRPWRAYAAQHLWTSLTTTGEPEKAITPTRAAGTTP